MRNYFYSEGVFVPFEKVLLINVSNDWTSIYVKVNNIDKSYEFPYIEITYYMEWLALKQQALEKNLENKANKPAIQMDDIAVSQPKWLIKAWESATDKKYKDLTKKDYKDFLAECEYILVYHGLIPVDKNIKLTNTKLKLKPEITEEMLLDIIKAFDLDICDACEYYDLNKQYSYPCCECGTPISKFKSRKNILDELNSKWKELK